MSRRVVTVASLVFLSSIFFFSHAALAERVFYVDPDWLGPANGSASAPWTSLTAVAWTTINAALAIDDVTVYFSARNAASDTNETTTAALSIARTDMSTHRLTFDGMSQYNTSDTSPSWLPYTGSSRFQITTTYPVTTANNLSGVERNYWTLRGFRVIATNGQQLFMTAVRHVIVENNHFSSDLTGVPVASRVGPGVIVSKPVLATSIAGVDVTIRNNIIHDTFGEGIYIGGYYACGEGAPLPCPGFGAGDTLLIENNTIYDTGTWGEEGDSIDIKDAWTNVTVRGNTIYNNNYGTGSQQQDGIITNSAAVIEGNFIYNKRRNGITLTAFYGAFNGFWTGAVVRNNVIVNCGLGTDSWGYGIAYPEKIGVFAFVTPQIYNNTVYGMNKPGAPGAARGIYIGPTVETTVDVYNNIVSGTNGSDFESAAGKLSTHGNNDYWHSGAGVTVATYGSSLYTSATLTAFESNSLSVNPLFVNTAPPYLVTNFGLQSTSPLCGRNMGAIPCGAGTTPQAPTNTKLQ